MIYDLTPSAHRTIWGGQNLERLKNLPVDKSLDPYGETWEISVHPQGPSLINGKKIEEVVSGSIPYMVKFIDTAKALSVQVHPDDEYARIHENSSGKAECYLILEAQEDAILYLGMKQGVTRESFLDGLKNKKNMSEYLNAFKVKKGDFFFTPPGSVHAIGAGITMVEVQQSSGITYRVWDWDRVDSSGKPRQLHIDKSLDVLNFDPKKNTREFFKAASGLFNHIGRKKIVEHNTFNFSLINLGKGETIELEVKDYGRLASVLNLQGKITINDKTIEAYSSVLMKDEKKISVVAHESTSFLLIE